MSVTDDVLATCPLRSAPWPTPAGCCAWCGNQLPKRARRWCSRQCTDEFTRQHNWQWAREAALERDGGLCVTCRHDGTVPGEDVVHLFLVILSPRLTYADRQRSISYVRSHAPLWRLEVNHQEPVRGRHGTFGCHHHLDGLETLCHPCHLKVTAKQFGHRRQPDTPSLFDLLENTA